MTARPLTAFLAATAASAAIAGAESPRLEHSQECITLVNAGHKLTLSLKDGSLDLVTPHGDRRFVIQIMRGSDWVQPDGRAEPPGVRASGSSVRARVKLSVPDNRELILEIAAYRGIPAVFVTTRLVNLGDTRAEYYFWSWNGAFDHYFTPGTSGIDRREVDKTSWTRFGYHDWVFLPAQTGGLAVYTTGSLGRAPGENGAPFLNALPSSRNLGKGESLDVAFGLADVRDAAEAALLWRPIRSRRIPEASPSPRQSLPADLNYGAPAPDWLRTAEIYNGFYKTRDDWSRANIRDLLSTCPLIVGVPHDRAVIDRCHRARVRLIPYVNYMELLDTKIEEAARGTVYYEWLQSVDHEALDLANHPDWICLDSQGRNVPSTWGSQNGHPGLFYTCFHQDALRRAALEQVHKLMEMGADGVFIDNAGPVADCSGAALGKHTHAGSNATNTSMYESLQREIYALVKSFGSDRIVMHNSTIIPGHWSCCDAQMWESCVCGAGTPRLMQEWPELEYAGGMHAEAVRRGKVPVILPYVGSQPEERRLRLALYSYAYARLYGFLWADWFTLADRDADRNAALELYSARLGKPVSSIKVSGEVRYRLFERGAVALNPSHDAASADIPCSTSNPIRDVSFGRSLSPAKGKLRIDLTPESGRVLTW